MTSRRWLWTEVEERVERLNRLLVGWANYFYLGQVTKAYAAVDRHACNRLRRCEDGAFRERTCDSLSESRMR